MGAQAQAEFSAMFDGEFAYVCRVLRRLGVRAMDLEDQAQEVFVAVHRKLAEYDRNRPLRPWLFSFAFRTASNYQRLVRHSRERLLEAEALDDFDTPESRLADRDAQRLVLAALDGVPLERRSVLIMHDIDGFSAPEIADALAIPLNTVYSRVRVAREEFRSSLARVKAKGRAR